MKFVVFDRNDQDSWFQHAEYDDEQQFQDDYGVLDEGEGDVQQVVPGVWLLLHPRTGEASSLVVRATD